MENDYLGIIGFEVHVELKTLSKMFCGCKNDPFHAPKPNIYTCPVCLGLPGALPVPNKKAVEWTIMLGLALGCEIPLLSKFDRKNYFYPDLPKGYQISQYDQPIARNGALKFKVQSSKFKVEKKTVRIQRVHLEEDTGKLLHSEIDGKKVTLIDFNRSGVPLVEIVTEPDIHSGEDAKAFLKKLHQIIRYLEISDANMEKGSMRLEPNISIKVKSQKSKVKSNELPKYKVEVKNINSFNFAKRAIEFELQRQTVILDRGGTPAQETRGWNEGKGETVPQRSKEEAHDYRYFPEPDIPPMRFTGKQISDIKARIEEMPDDKISRFVRQYRLNDYDAVLIAEKKQRADYFEKTAKILIKAAGDKIPNPAKVLANWIINKRADTDKTSPQNLAAAILQSTCVPAVSDEELEEVIKKVLLQNPKAVEDYKKGKEQALGFLAGNIRKILRDKADMHVILDMLKKRLTRKI